VSCETEPAYVLPRSTDTSHGGKKLRHGDIINGHTSDVVSNRQAWVVGDQAQLLVTMTDSRSSWSVRRIPEDIHIVAGWRSRHSLRISLELLIVSS
jgi:photosystem II stability/assembly factor-like uncharacterized protein